MGLRTKLNLLLLIVGALGAALFAAVSYFELRNLAEQEVEERARLMMAAAKSVRDYTAKNVKDCFEDKMKRDKIFYPQAVSAYAAVETFKFTQKNLPDKPEYKDYSYKERALNPTKLEHKAQGMDIKIIEDFVNNDSKQDSKTQERGVTGELLLYSAPLKADGPCLDCHSTPEKAPKPMTDKYGRENGFHWGLKEVIGAQIVSVPIQLAIDRALNLLTPFLAVYLGVLAVLGAVLNVGLEWMVTRPVREMSRVARAVSMGKDRDEDEFVWRGSDEIADLAQSFTRMRRALELNEDQGPRSSERRDQI
jgi:HAMP domain-containing protein